MNAFQSSDINYTKAVSIAAEALAAKKQTDDLLEALSALEEKNSRKFSRKNFPTLAKYVNCKLRGRGMITNMSAGGVYLKMQPLPEIGQEFMLNFSPPRCDEELEVPAVVVWRDDEGAGLEYKVSADFSRIISLFL